jgi:hypothetical protein
MILREEPGFEEARVDRIFNRRLTARQPAAVVRPVTDDEVVDAVRLAREQLVDGVEQALAHQRARLLGVAGPGRGRGPVLAPSGYAIASKSTFSRTAQSGQHQSSGTSLQGVPGGNPSRGAPLASS